MVVRYFRVGVSSSSFFVDPCHGVWWQVELGEFGAVIIGWITPNDYLQDNPDCDAKYGAMY